MDAGESWSRRPQQDASSQRCDRRGMVACRVAASASQARRRLLSTGCQWRAIPKDLPPKSTFHDYINLWDWDGTLDRIPARLCVKRRETAGREASPTAAGKVIASVNFEIAKRSDRAKGFVVLSRRRLQLVKKIKLEQNCVGAGGLSVLRLAPARVWATRRDETQRDRGCAFRPGAGTEGPAAGGRPGLRLACP